MVFGFYAGIVCLVNSGRKILLGPAPGLLPKYCPGVQLLRFALGEVPAVFADAAGSVEGVGLK